jgi:hypothetical protein
MHRLHQHLPADPVNDQIERPAAYLNDHVVDAELPKLLPGGNSTEVCCS